MHVENIIHAYWTWSQDVECHYAIMYDNSLFVYRLLSYTRVEYIVYTCWIYHARMLNIAPACSWCSREMSPTDDLVLTLPAPCTNQFKFVSMKFTVNMHEKLCEENILFFKKFTVCNKSYPKYTNFYPSSYLTNKKRNTRDQSDTMAWNPNKYIY